jgi:hypothetical protein
MSYKPQMHGGGESYSGGVPAKQLNECLGGQKEAVEDRPLTKENTGEPNSCRTQSRESEPSGLERPGRGSVPDVRQASGRRNRR